MLHLPFHQNTTVSVSLSGLLSCAVWQCEPSLSLPWPATVLVLLLRRSLVKIFRVLTLLQRTDTFVSVRRSYKGPISARSVLTLTVVSITPNVYTLLYSCAVECADCEKRLPNSLNFPHPHFVDHYWGIDRHVTLQFSFLYILTAV